MQIIIPMGGIGKRFRNEGYKTPKYMLDAGNKLTVIANLVRSFPKDSNFLFILNDDDHKNIGLVSHLEALSLYAKVISIDSHSEGPVETLLRAQDFIDLEDEIIVSYCDYIIAWDYFKFLAFSRSVGSDCTVAVYNGYHPHHKVDGDKYGYCRLYEDSLRVKDYKEKDSFSDNPIQEQASCGLYYFKKGHDLISFSHLLKNSGHRINNEMYVSMVAMEFINAGKSVYVDEVRYMLQMGTPRDYETTYYYFDALLTLFTSTINSESISLPCILPMAGKGSRFSKQGIRTPKQFLPLFDSIAFKFSTFGIDANNLFIGILNDVFENYSKLLNQSAHVSTINEVLNGQALTCKYILDNAEIDGPFIITPCDSAVTLNHRLLNNFIASELFDIIIIVCDRNPATSENETAYSWVLYDKLNNALSIDCKANPFVSENYNKDSFYGHIDGTFIFKDKRTYDDLFLMVQESGFNTSLGEFYVDEIVQKGVEIGLSVKVFKADHYICYGTPSEYNEVCYYYNALKAISEAKSLC